MKLLKNPSEQSNKETNPIKKKVSFNLPNKQEPPRSEKETPFSQ